MRQLRVGQAGRPRVFEFCENGAKATAWEITRKRVTPEFFADTHGHRTESGTITIWRRGPPDASDALGCARATNTSR